MVKKITKCLMVMTFALFCLTAVPDEVLAKEIKIAIIDSGASRYADFTHSFTSYSANEDPLNHGTQIAKIIRKVSPNAKIYMLQVCESSNGILRPSRKAILEAIQWSIENQMDIVNMSFVTRYDDAIQEAIKEAVLKHKIVFIAAAGNYGIKERYTAGEDGFMKRKGEVQKPAFPSSSPYVISVGALDSAGSTAPYSAHMSDIEAPGKLNHQEGTSFASARVTASIANLLINSNLPRDPKTLLSYL